MLGAHNCILSRISHEGNLYKRARMITTHMSLVSVSCRFNRLDQSILISLKPSLRSTSFMAFLFLCVLFPLPLSKILNGKSFIRTISDIQFQLHPPLRCLMGIV